MNKTLSLLMAFVFLNATSWAFPPNYAGNSGNSASNFAGVYAGVLVPSGVSTGSTSLGIFAIGIPGSGAATVISSGTGVLFADGAGYILDINGVVDPQSLQLSAIIEGVSNFQVIENEIVGGIITPVTFSILAEGQLQATLSQPKGGHSAVTGPGTSSAAQINGTGTIDTFTRISTTAPFAPVIDTTIKFSVQGFQESGTYSVPTLPTASPTGGG
jgi:hypothetical protein